MFLLGLLRLLGFLWTRSILALFPLVRLWLSFLESSRILFACSNKELGNNSCNFNFRDFRRIFSKVLRKSFPRCGFRVVGRLTGDKTAARLIWPFALDDISSARLTHSMSIVIFNGSTACCNLRRAFFTTSNSACTCSVFSVFRNSSLSPSRAPTHPGDHGTRPSKLSCSHLDSWIQQKTTLTSIRLAHNLR